MLLFIVNYLPSTKGPIFMYFFFSKKIQNLKFIMIFTYALSTGVIKMKNISPLPIPGEEIY